MMSCFKITKGGLAMRIILFSLLLIGLNPLWGKTFTILHTNDWQSRLLGFHPLTRELQTENKTIGGIARLATAIDKARGEAQNKGPVLVLDAGDYTMGTLFHTVAKEKGYEIQLLGMLGYDAVCLGNHEFDFGPQGLASMIRAAQSKGSLPAILSANMVPSKDNPKDQGIRELVAEKVIAPYTVLVKQGIRFGLFGIMGKDASEVAPNSKPVQFSDALTSAQAAIDHLREKENVHMTIMISHSGVMQKADGTWGGEEVEFAEKLKGLNIIIGGHSHTPIPEPIVANGIPIVQAGSEARYLGQLTMELTEKKTSIKSYKLIPINNDVEEKAVVAARIQEAKDTVDEDILKPLGFKFDTPFAEAMQGFDREYGSFALGHLIAEAIRKATAADIGFIANGSIRDDIAPGHTGVQTVAEVFRILPLGLGPLDGKPGYPLIRMYLTAEEVKSVLEILLVGYKMKGDSYYPRYAGVRFKYNPLRVPMDQIYSIDLQQKDGSYQPIDFKSDKLYAIGTTSYIASFMWLVGDISYGLHSVVPKNAQGKPLADLMDALVDKDLKQPGVQEYKAWVAFMDHIANLKDTNNSGLPEINSDHTNPMVAHASLHPSTLFGMATKIQWVGFLAMLLVLALFLYIALRILRKLQNNKHSTAKSSVTA